MNNLSQDITIKELYYADEISVRAFHCCQTAEINTVGELYNYRKEHRFSEIKNCGRKTCREFDDICRRMKDFPEHHSSLDDKVRQTEYGTISAISKVKNAFLKEEFEKLKNRMSVRARNICNSTYQNYTQIIPYFSYSEKAYKKLFITKRKSADELYTFLIAFKDVYEQFESTDDDTFIQLKEEEKYPFLLKPELDFVKEKEVVLGHLPMFYIVERYISIASDRGTSFFAQHFGISGSSPLSLDELAELNHSSRERVRQIISRFILPVELISKTDARWTSYKNILPLVVTDESSFYKQVVEEEALNTSFLSFAGLLIAIFDYCIVRFHKKIILVPQRYKEDTRHAIKAIYDLFQTKYSTDSTFIITSAFKIRTAEKIRLYREIIEAMFGVAVSSQNEFTIKQGRVSVEDEIIEVLKLFGEPMTIDELFLLFKDKYPEHKYTDAKSLRPYIAKNSRIVAIGKSGLYGLSEWNLFTGSIRDCAYQILKKSTIPLPDEELSGKILMHFPNSNTRSIISSLMSDGKERFVHFQNFCTGLASREYPKEYKLSQSIIPFEERLFDLRNFITKYRRYPFMRGGEEEESLYRWIRNHTKPGAMFDETQAEQINQLLQEFTQYPHTETEYKFFNYCSEYKHFITSNFCLPNIDSEDGKEQELAEWFIKSHMRVKTYDDNRVQYFNDVLQFMNGYGFVVD